MLNINLKAVFKFGNVAVATSAPYLSLENDSEIMTANPTAVEQTIYLLEDVTDFKLEGDVVEFWTGTIEGQKMFRREFLCRSQPIAYDKDSTKYQKFIDYENFVKNVTTSKFKWVKLTSKLHGLTNTIYYPVEVADIAMEAGSMGLYYMTFTLRHKYINK